MLGKPTTQQTLSSPRKFLFAALALALSLSVACGSLANTIPTEPPSVVYIVYIVTL